MDHEPIAETLARLRAGDREAFGALYVDTFERLLRFATAIHGSEDIAREVVQDVFLTLWTRRETLDVHTDLLTYLFTAVRNRARKRVRRDAVARHWATNTARRSDDAPPFVTTPPAPDAQAHATDLRRAVFHALATIPERDRAILLLRWDEGLTYEQIGQITGVSAMGAHKIVARASAIVRRLLGPYQD